MNAPVIPAVGGSRTLAQLEALARLRAGEAVDPAELHEKDRPKPPSAEPDPPAERTEAHA